MRSAPGASRSRAASRDRHGKAAARRSRRDRSRAARRASTRDDADLRASARILQSLLPDRRRGRCERDSPISSHGRCRRRPPARREMFVENPAHEYRLSISVAVGGLQDGVQARGSPFACRDGGTACPLTRGPPRPIRHRPMRGIAMRDAAGSADAAGVTYASSAAACTNSLNPGRARQREPLPPWRSPAVRAQARRRGQPSRCRLGPREP